jgi:hypothetical protein
VPSDPVLPPSPQAPASGGARTSSWSNSGGSNQNGAPRTDGDPSRLAEIVVAAGTPQPLSRIDRARALAKAVPILDASARGAGLGAVTAGRWITDVVLDIAPQIPIRNRLALRQHFPRRTDAQIAEELIRTASRATAALGASAGALAAVEFAAPPALLAAPAQLAAHLVAVMTVEIKLVAELHELAGRRPAGGISDRAGAYLLSWTHRRAVGAIFGTRAASGLSEGSSGITAVLGTTAVGQLRKVLVRRFAHSTATLAPLLVGAAAGAELDRRTTRAIGRRVAKDLGIA